MPANDIPACRRCGEALFGFTRMIGLCHNCVKEQNYEDKIIKARKAKKRARRYSFQGDDE